MYAYRVEKKEIAYWRKHNRLHGWFTNKWHELGNDHELNVTDFYLDDEILNELEEAVKNNKLPETEGFFFGDDSYKEDKEELEKQKQEDLQFIAEARRILDEGGQVVYHAWY